MAGTSASVLATSGGDDERTSASRLKCVVAGTHCARAIGAFCIMAAGFGLVEMASILTRGGGTTMDRPPNTRGNFVCEGCGGYCPDASDCSTCYCLMVPRGCMETEDGDCWDQSYEESLRPVERALALCSADCGL